MQSFQPPGSTANSFSKTARSMDSWHFALTQNQLPAAGCFKAVYPSTQWDRIDCSAPPHHWYPVPPSVRGGFAQVVGGGVDYTADMDPNIIIKAIGAFPQVEGVKRYVV
jgi:hypothetical protein